MLVWIIQMPSKQTNRTYVNTNRIAKTRPQLTVSAYKYTNTHIIVSCWHLSSIACDTCNLKDILPRRIAQTAKLTFSSAAASFFFSSLSLRDPNLQSVFSSAEMQMTDVNCQKKPTIPKKWILNIWWKISAQFAFYNHNPKRREQTNKTKKKKETRNEMKLFIFGVVFFWAIHYVRSKLKDVVCIFISERQTQMKTHKIRWISCGCRNGSL